MLVTVDEAKLYLRLDGTEEDALIQALLETAESLCQDIVRTDFDEMEEVPEIGRRICQWQPSVLINYFMRLLQRMKMKRKPMVLRCSLQKRFLWSCL